MVSQPKRLPRRGGRANSFTCIREGNSDSHLSFRRRVGNSMNRQNSTLIVLADLFCIKDSDLVTSYCHLFQERGVLFQVHANQKKCSLMIRCCREPCFSLENTHSRNSQARSRYIFPKSSLTWYQVSHVFDPGSYGRGPGLWCRNLDAEFSFRGIGRVKWREKVRSLQTWQKAAAGEQQSAVGFLVSPKCCRLTYAQGSSFRIINANDGKARAFNYVEYTSQSLSLPEQLV